MGHDRIGLDHGSGGAASHELILRTFLRRLDNEALRRLDDSAVVEMGGHRLAVTTDSYVVDPIFFPGGDIGSLAVHGTVNDLAMQGADPLYLTLALILEEGLPMKDLSRIVDSVAEATRKAGVQVIAGDTKVVPKGHADKIFINTSGIGIVPGGVNVSADNARPRDVLLINGPIGDHGMAILTRREGLEFESPLVSDSAPLNGLVSDLLHLGPEIHVLRDPTRGGVATALNEIARQSHVSIQLDEGQLPVSRTVAAACEMLGLDPLYVANEGKCLVILSRDHAETALGIMRRHPLGKESRVIGEVTAQKPPRVLLRTRVGGTRILTMLTGEQLPRIC